MKRWCWVLLIVELALFALMLVLPEADLPAFTFQGGTAPVVAKARFSFSPGRSLPLIAAQVWFSLQFLYSRPESFTKVAVSARIPGFPYSAPCSASCFLS